MRIALCMLWRAPESSSFWSETTTTTSHRSDLASLSRPRYSALPRQTPCCCGPQWAPARQSAAMFKAIFSSSSSTSSKRQSRAESGKSQASPSLRRPQRSRHCHRQQCLQTRCYRPAARVLPWRLGRCLPFRTSARAPHRHLAH